MGTRWREGREGQDGQDRADTTYSIARADNVSMQIQVMLLAMTLAVLGQTIKPLPTIEVTAQADLKAVESLHDALGTLSEKVTACFNERRKGEDCRCSYPQDLARVRKGYETLIQQHPDWKDQLLSYRSVTREGRPVSATLVLQNLRRQLEALKCE